MDILTYLGALLGLAVGVGAVIGVELLYKELKYVYNNLIISIVLRVAEIIVVLLSASMLYGIIWR